MTLCNWNICKIMQNLIIFCISSCRTPAFTRNMFTNFEKQAYPASLCFLNYCWRFCNVYIFSACFSESRDKNGSFKQIFKVLQIVLLAQKGRGSFMPSRPPPPSPPPPPQRKVCRHRKAESSHPRITFNNIHLKNKLSRVISGIDSEFVVNCTFIHFHGLLKRICGVTFSCNLLKM